MITLSPPSESTTCRQRDKIREIRSWLRDYWRHLRPGTHRRELCTELIEQVDGLLRRQPEQSTPLTAIASRRFAT